MVGNQPWQTQSISTSDVPNNLTLTERPGTNGTTLEALTLPASISHRETVADDVFDLQLNGRVSPRTKEAIAKLRQELGIADNSAFIRQMCYLTLELHERGLLRVEQTDPTQTRNIRLILNENEQPDRAILLTTFDVTEPQPSQMKGSFQRLVDGFFNLVAAIRNRGFNRQDGTH